MNQILPIKSIAFLVIISVCLIIPVMAKSDDNVPPISAERDKSEIMCEKLPMEADGIVRLSKIEIYPEYRDEYLRYAVEVGETSLKNEPGVLTMYAMADRNNPDLITILETYSSQDAYKKHIASAHFQKYKQGTLHMVKSLELCDQQPLNEKSILVNKLEQ